MGRHRFLLRTRLARQRRGRLAGLGAVSPASSGRSSRGGAGTSEQARRIFGLSTTGSSTASRVGFAPGGARVLGEAVRVERDVRLDELALDGGDLRARELARAEQTVAAGDRLDVAAAAHVRGEERQLAPRRACCASRVRPPALGAHERARARRLGAPLGGERQIDERHEHDVASVHRLLAEVVVAIERPGLVALAEEAVRDREERVARRPTT